MMIVGRPAAVAFGTVCLLFADDEVNQRLQVERTERIDLPAKGVLRVKKSIGELTIEGWDGPDVEITTTKSTQIAIDSRDREKASRELEKVSVSTERRGDDVVVTTTPSRRRGFLAPSPLRGATGVELRYRIKAPRAAQVVVDHEDGEVHLEDLTGDVHVTARRGEITVRVPQAAQYTINAKSDLGAVVSDFPGRAQRTPWLFGHRFVQEVSPAAHKLYLRTGFGDIIILRIRKPSTPSHWSSVGQELLK
jgi:Putative adhesin